MTTKDIEDAVREKVLLSRKYGMPNVRIHGINEINVKKINEFLEKAPVMGEFGLVAKKILDKRGIIVIELII